jgi:hypothetical protein
MMFSLLLSLVGVAFSAPGIAQTSDRPNILVIMADDVGWMNVSAYGGDIMGAQTPNIDRIAREGLRMTSFYAGWGRSREVPSGRFLLLPRPQPPVSPPRPGQCYPEPVGKRGQYRLSALSHG